MARNCKPCMLGPFCWLVTYLSCCVDVYGCCCDLMQLWQVVQVLRVALRHGAARSVIFISHHLNNLVTTTAICSTVVYARYLAVDLFYSCTQRLFTAPAFQSREEACVSAAGVQFCHRYGHDHSCVLRCAGVSLQTSWCFAGTIA